jgi:hypothetical protein
MNDRGPEREIRKGMIYNRVVEVECEGWTAKAVKVRGDRKKKRLIYRGKGGIRYKYQKIGLKGVVIGINKAGRVKKVKGRIKK